jgi:exonuclease SbcC
MLGWMFKKDDGSPADGSDGGGEAAGPAGAAPADDAGGLWAARLQAAAGDDAALLALARDEAPLQVKLDAVAGLAAEDSLRLAEREFRSHDRRVHQLAKQRHQAQVAQREAREQATRLIAAAVALADERPIPTNRLVEIDRAWQALEHGLLEASQREAFDAQLGQLKALTLEHGDHALQLERWLAEGRRALAGLQACAAAAAAGEQGRDALAAAAATARQIAEAAPAGAPASALGDALRGAVEAVELLDERLRLLHELMHGSARPRPPAPVATASASPAVPSLPGVQASSDDASSSQAQPPQGIEPAATEALLPHEAAAQPLATAAHDAVSHAAVAPGDDAVAHGAPQAANVTADPVAEPPDEVPAAPAAEPTASALPTATDDHRTSEALALEQATAHDEAVGVAELALLDAAPDQAPAAAHAVEGVADGSEQAIASASADAHGAPEGHASTSAGPVAPPTPLQRWLQLPPLPEAQWNEALGLRFEQWQQAREEARQARQTQRREQVKDRQRAVRTERTATLAEALDQAEAALAAGQLAQTNQHLVAIDDLLHGGAQAGALRGRIDAVQAQYAQLKGWQHWGGGLARDELVLQAQALAAATGPQATAPVVKLSIKQRTEVIDDMRSRWKELDRLGGATSRALWQRFDAALKAAYEPVAEHLAAQRAAREQNLQARRQLIEALDAVALPAPREGSDEPPSASDWKPHAQALDRFHAEWRKLGPLEHTVPHKQRAALLERMGAAVARLEQPLMQARQGAQRGREELIARARALGEQAAARAQDRDLVGRVRELQALWQQQARSLPLARGAENALWAEFKGAIDAVFSARDAAFDAREAQFKVHGAERAALIDRLAAMNADTPPAELRRTLADAEAQWQRIGPAPRADAAALDAAFWRARDAVREWLAGSFQRGWQQACDAMLAKLELCSELEQTGDAAAARAALPERWAALPAAPPVWEQALAQRAGLAAKGRTAPVAFAGSADELLLQLELAFQLASPAAFEAARRALKLHAMKAALEGRGAKAVPLGPDELMAAALGRPALDEAQRERLVRVVAELRRRGPPGG